MPLASTKTSDSRFMAMFVGEKHSGKTSAACSWITPGTDKLIYVLDGDGRIAGINGCPWINKERVYYQYFQPRVAGNEVPFFRRVNDELESILLSVGQKRCIYETFVADSLTAFTKNLVLDALPLTHAGNKGKMIGGEEQAGPADYGFESTQTDKFLSYLRSLPLNVICTAHIIPKWDKPTVNGQKDPYAESIVVGEKISLRDKISANTSIYFDHIFKFSRRILRGEERFFVELVSDLACTSFPGFKTGEYDITGKDFRTWLLARVAENLLKLPAPVLVGK